MHRGLTVFLNIGSKTSKYDTGKNLVAHFVEAHGTPVEKHCPSLILLGNLLTW